MAKKSFVDISAATDKLKQHIGQALQHVEGGTNAAMPASNVLGNSERPALEENRRLAAGKRAQEAAAKLAALAQKVMGFH